MQSVSFVSTHRVFLSASELSRSLEVHTQEGKLRLLALADILDSIDMEGHGIAIDRENDGLRLPVNEDLTRSRKRH